MRVALVHRVPPQKGSALHRISRSTASKGLDCLKMRLFASPMTLLASSLACWALALRTLDQPTALSSTFQELQGRKGDVRSMSDQNLAPILQLREPYSCIWKIKRAVLTSTIKVVNTTIHPGVDSKLAVITGSPATSFQKALSWDLVKPTCKQLLSWHWGLSIALASNHLGATSLAFQIFIVVVEFLIPKRWSLRNFST